VSGRLAGIAAAALVLAVALVVVARWERARHADDANDGIERVYEAVGALDAPNLEGFRMLEEFQCLIYRAGGRMYGLELCVDWEGRVVEAFDRRGDSVRISSLREDPELARVRVDRRAFERVVEGMCDDCAAIFERARERARSGALTPGVSSRR
jgi:hypothetical protein